MPGRRYSRPISRTDSWWRAARTRSAGRPREAWRGVDRSRPKVRGVVLTRSTGRPARRSAPSADPTHPPATFPRTRRSFRAARTGGARQHQRRDFCRERSTPRHASRADQPDPVQPPSTTNPSSEIGRDTSAGIATLPLRIFEPRLGSSAPRRLAERAEHRLDTSSVAEVVRRTAPTSPPSNAMPCSTPRRRDLAQPRRTAPAPARPPPPARSPPLRPRRLRGPRRRLAATAARPPSSARPASPRAPCEPRDGLGRRRRAPPLALRPRHRMRRHDRHPPPRSGARSCSGVARQGPILSRSPQLRQSAPATPTAAFFFLEQHPSATLEEIRRQRVPWATRCVDGPRRRPRRSGPRRLRRGRFPCTPCPLARRTRGARRALPRRPLRAPRRVAPHRRALATPT